MMASSPFYILLKMIISKIYCLFKTDLFVLVCRVCTLSNCVFIICISKELFASESATRIQQVLVKQGIGGYC